MDPFFRDTPLFGYDAPFPREGLICGFQMPAGAAPREFHAQDLATALAEGDAVTWLHFNLNDGRVLRWLTQAEFLPQTFRDVLDEHEPGCRAESTDDGLVLVVHDLAIAEGTDPSALADFWAYATPRFLITARRHPLKCADGLRLSLRSGLYVRSGIELMTEWFELRTEALRSLEDGIAKEVDQIEDEILRERIATQRERLGVIRRRCSHLRRHFSPERSALQKLILRPPAWLGETGTEGLKSVRDALGFLIEDMGELYERAKLLQEELAARLAEGTAHNLHALAVLTAVFLPMTLVTGIFGMNVAGLPGTSDAGSFWWVMLLILACGVITLAALWWKRPF